MLSDLAHSSAPRPPAAPPPRGIPRFVTAALLAPQLAYAAWASHAAISEWSNPLADGFGMIPAFFATPPLLALTLPVLVLTALGRAPKTAFTLSLAGLVLTPFVAWQMLLASALDALFPVAASP